MNAYGEDHFGDMSAIALEKLKAGEVDDDFRTIAHDLTLTNQYPALTEGTLLMVGGTLHEASQPEEQADRKEILSPAARVKNVLIYLAFAQGDIMRNGLRPIGRQILDHCMELATDEEVKTVLENLQGFDQNAPSAN